MTQTPTQPYQIVRGQTLIHVPHKEAILSVVHPPEGPDTYINAAKAVLARNLAPITAEEIVSLEYAAHCGPEEFREEPEVRNVRDATKKQRLWVLSRRLWTPEGVYVVLDPEAIGLSQPLDAETLEERLKGSKEVVKGVRFSKDETVRFAERGSYTLGEHTSVSLAKDGSVIAEYNLLGAENLGEVSTKFRNPPFVRGVDIKKGEEPVQRLSALASYWDSHRLLLYSNDRGNDWGGAVLFGVRKTG